MPSCVAGIEKDDEEADPDEGARDMDNSTRDLAKSADASESELSEIEVR